MVSAEDPDSKPKTMHKLKSKIANKAKSLFTKNKKDSKDAEPKETPKEEPKTKIVTPTAISDNLDKTRKLLLEKKLKVESVQQQKNDTADERITENEKKTNDDVSKKDNKVAEDVKVSKCDNVSKDDRVFDQVEEFVYVSVKPKTNSQSSSDSGFLESFEFIKSFDKPEGQETDKSPGLDEQTFERVKEQTVQRNNNKTNEPKTVEHHQKATERRSFKTEEEDENAAALIEKLVKLEISMDRSDDGVVEDFQKLTIDARESEEEKKAEDDRKKKHHKKILISRGKQKNRDFRTTPSAPYPQQINQVNDRIMSGGNMIVKETIPLEQNNLYQLDRPLCQQPPPSLLLDNKEVEYCMNQVMAVLPNDIIDTILESQSGIQNQQFDQWSSPEHQTFSLYEGNLSPNSFSNSPPQQLPSVETSQDFINQEYYTDSPEIQEILKASPNYTVPSFSNDGIQKEAGVFEALQSAFDGAQFDGTHDFESQTFGEQNFVTLQKPFDETQKLFNPSPTFEEGFIGTQKVFDDTQKGFHNFEQNVFSDLACQDVLNDDFFLRLDGNVHSADPLTPPRSDYSNSPSPALSSPKYTESYTHNSPQSDDSAMSPSGRILGTEQTYIFSNESPDRDRTTPTIKLDKLEEEKSDGDEKLKRQTPVNMSMFKKQMQALSARYASLACCRRERAHAKDALVRHLERCSREQRRQMTLAVAKLSVAQLFQLLYYRVLPALESLSASANTREDVDCALLALICQRLLAEKPDVFLDEDFGLALLSRAAVRCSNRPELVRYLVWCVRRALAARAQETGPVFTQTDISGDNLAGALARLGDSHANCLAEIVVREPRERPLLDLEHRNTEGYSALHLACQLHNARSGPHTTHVVHILMTHGNVPVTLPDNKAGNTALHCAVDAGGCDLQLVLTLFRDVPANKRRALAYCKNAGMKTPIELARCASRTRPDYPSEVLEFLKKCRT